MSFLQKNSEVIALKQPELAQKIINHNYQNSDFQFVETHPGLVNLSYNNVLLHLNNPKEEVEKELERIKPRIT